jgi:hypothetical protein
MRNEFIETVEAVSQEKVDGIFKIRLGSFVNYSTSDTSTRRASIQLYNIEKTPDKVPPIPYVLDDVPILYMGNNRAQEDFSLLAGDEMLILFSDTTTDVWRNLTGNIPAKNEREERHSIDYAVAIPVVSIHQPLTASVLNHYQIKLQAGQKLQIGIETGPGVFSVELIQEMYTVFNQMAALTTTDGDGFAASFLAFQTGPLAALLTKLQTLGTVV